jgi:hypothetical protein
MLGDSGIGFTDNACTSLSVLAGVQKLIGKVNVKEAIKNFRYTDRKKYPRLPRGLMIWSQSDFEKLGIKFAGRFYGRPSHLKATSIASSKDQFAILELDGGAHWVFLDKWSIVPKSWFLAGDSWAPNTNKPYGYFHKIDKHRITGYSLFKLI